MIFWIKIIFQKKILSFRMHVVVSKSCKVYVKFYHKRCTTLSTDSITTCYLHIQSCKTQNNLKKKQFFKEYNLNELPGRNSYSLCIKIRK